MKKLNIKVIPNAKKEKIVEEKDRLKIYVTAPALDGRANDNLVDILSEHFCVKKKNIRIAIGQKTRNKVVEID